MHWHGGFGPMGLIDHFVYFVLFVVSRLALVRNAAGPHWTLRSLPFAFRPLLSQLLLLRMPTIEPLGEVLDNLLLGPLENIRHGAMLAFILIRHLELSGPGNPFGRDG